jgi:HEAT repeat protein
MKSLFLLVLVLVSLCGCSSYSADRNSSDADQRRLWIQREASHSDDDILEVRAFLNDPDSLVRAAAVQFFQELGNPRYAERILEMTKDPVHIVRLDAVEALGALGHRGALERLHELVLTDENALVRVRVTQVLATFGDKASIPVLVEAMTVNEYSVRAAARDALERLTGERGRPAEPEAWNEFK